MKWMMYLKPPDTGLLVGDGSILQELHSFGSFSLTQENWNSKWLHCGGIYIAIYREGHDWLIWCLGKGLLSRDRGCRRSHPLSRYAQEHWATCGPVPVSVSCGPCSGLGNASLYCIYINFLDRIQTLRHDLLLATHLCSNSSHASNSRLHMPKTRGLGKLWKMWHA